MNIARRITGEEIPFLDLNEKNSFFSKIFGKHKRY